MLLNIFHSGGLWIIPFILLCAAGYSFYRAYKQHKSGYHRMDIDPGSKTFGQWLDTPPGEFFKLPSFLFGAIFFVFAVITFLMINADYKGV